PYMGALDPHVFVTGSQPFNQLVIQPDTMYFINEAHNSFTIYNLTPASFDINEVTSNFEFMQFIELPSLPITLAPGDSLVVEVVIYILVSHSYQPNAFVEGIIHVVSTIGEADVVMMVNEQLLSALDETENQNAIVYPNPFTTQLFLRLPEGSKGNSEVKIYSSTGQLVFEQSFTTFESEFSIKWDGKSLDGNRLPEGVYFYHLHNGDKTYSGKMVYDQP
ncbi:MAG: T9SS type A sorting domain-containing protein, partial [Bacteroidales bacterium]|nr:T9SS type A sorting domain-containing protein [Bacteroidales bacterium]